MLDTDDFESAFRSADKRRFQLRRPEIDHVAILSDLSGTQLDDFAASTRSLLSVLGEDVRWTVLGDADHTNITDAMEKLDGLAPDLVCAYRNLKSESWKWPFSLGSYINVLTRASDHPVLLLPHPGEVPTSRWRDSDTNSVLVVTDHLAGDDKIVNWGARLTRDAGVLHLAHVEDDATFTRYMDAISKIEGINTEFATAAIAEQLQKEPRDYAATCQQVLAAAGQRFGVEVQMRRGSKLEDYKHLIEEHDVDLLILRTTEEGQLAMHGASYLLAVELRSTPLLML